ncbi:MAG: hypothetical protein DMD47_03795 [Gemmatimonadetes bacterium]|nr:MAG: hypothetical protein DMD47_03795 [Gemmatimonadota bacterium]
MPEPTTIASNVLGLIGGSRSRRRSRG